MQVRGYTVELLLSDRWGGLDGFADMLGLPGGLEALPGYYKFGGTHVAAAR